MLNEAPNNNDVARVPNIDVPNINDITSVGNNVHLTTMSAQQFSMAAICTVQLNLNLTTYACGNCTARHVSENTRDIDCVCTID